MLTGMSPTSQLVCSKSGGEEDVTSQTRVLLPGPSITVVYQILYRKSKGGLTPTCLQELQARGRIKHNAVAVAAKDGTYAGGAGSGIGMDGMARKRCRRALSGGKASNR